MPRPLRFIPEESLVEITTRTLQGRLLLKPSPELTDIIAQDPHSKPATTDRSPAPFVHATDDSTEQELSVAYRAFVDAFRAGAQRLRDHAREIRDMFPLWAFPPQLPFKNAA